jgi:hypothetical protein
MQIIANLILLILVLIYFSVSYQIYFTRLPGGDAGVSWAWNIIYSYLIIIILMVILTWIIGSQGGYDSIGLPSSNKILIACAGSILISLGAGLASIMKGEPSFTPSIIHKIIIYISTFLPILFIICSFILLHRNWLFVSPTTMKIPLVGSAIVGLSAILLFVINLFLESIRNQENRIKSTIEQEEVNDQRMITEVESANVLSDVDFLQIMVFADDNKDSSVVNKAVAKIKSRPDWQETMVMFLKNDGALEVFNYLASHDPEKKELFPAAVNKGMYSVADYIRNRINEGSQSHHFYPDQYSWEVERALRSADRFKDMGVDFVPAAKAIKEALLQPHQIPRQPFNCIKRVDQWLKKNQK